MKTDIAEITTRAVSTVQTRHTSSALQSMEEFHLRVKSLLRLLRRNYFNDRSLLTSLYGPGVRAIVCQESGGVRPGIIGHHQSKQPLWWE